MQDAVYWSETEPRRGMVARGFDRAADRAHDPLDANRVRRAKRMWWSTTYRTPAKHRTPEAVVAAALGAADEEGVLDLVLDGLTGTVGPEALEITVGEISHAGSSAQTAIATVGAVDDYTQAALDLMYTYGRSARDLITGAGASASDLAVSTGQGVVLVHDRTWTALENIANGVVNVPQTAITEAGETARKVSGDASTGWMWAAAIMGVVVLGGIYFATTTGAAQTATREVGRTARAGTKALAEGTKAIGDGAAHLVKALPAVV